MLKVETSVLRQNKTVGYRRNIYRVTARAYGGRVTTARRYLKTENVGVNIYRRYEIRASVWLTGKTGFYPASRAEFSCRGAWSKKQLSGLKSAAWAAAKALTKEAYRWAIARTR